MKKIAKFGVFNSQGTQNTGTVTKRCSTEIAVWQKFSSECSSSGNVVKILKDIFEDVNF